MCVGIASIATALPERVTEDVGRVMDWSGPEETEGMEEAGTPPVDEKYNS